MPKASVSFLPPAGADGVGMATPCWGHLASLEKLVPKGRRHTRPFCLGSSSAGPTFRASAQESLWISPRFWLLSGVDHAQRFSRAFPEENAS